MRKLIYLLVIAGAAWGGYRYYQSRQVWTPYTSAEGRFAAEFPEPPQEGLQSVKTSDGTVEMHVVHATRGEREYAVAYRYYSGDWDDVSAEKRVQYLTFSATERGYRVRSSRAIKAGELEGVEMRYEIPGTPGVTTAHLFVRGGRLYSVMVTAPPFELWPEDADRFFDSFKLE